MTPPDLNLLIAFDVLIEIADRPGTVAKIRQPEGALRPIAGIFQRGMLIEVRVGGRPPRLPEAAPPPPLPCRWQR